LKISSKVLRGEQLKSKTLQIIGIRVIDAMPFKKLVAQRKYVQHHWLGFFGILDI
jgi:hypothetical protein